jgi:cell wall assembly regulator SMI1
MDHSLESALNLFFKEVKKYSARVHNLNAGVDISYIEQAETEMGIKFPEPYKSFLRKCNGGELFVPGTELSQIWHPDLGPKQKGVSYLNESFRQERRVPGMPIELLTIAHLNYGDSICIDLSKDSGFDAPVVQWDHETQCVSRTWGGFLEWLMDVLEEGSLLVDYQGNEKDLAF